MSTISQFDRRTFLQGLLCASAALALPASARAADTLVGTPLPPWTEGTFDIHHIDTARGNSTLLIFPDGTTMLIDAGAVPETTTAGTINPARPNASKRPGEWIATYIRAHAPSPRLDYFLATHLHGDHIDGFADVAAALPIERVLDRGFPNYAANQPPPATATAYLDLLRARVTAGHPVEAVQVGSAEQIVPRRNTTVAPNFRALILSANGNVWNPQTKSVEQHLANLPAATNTHGYENNFSIAIRFDYYGSFRYFTGGDLDCDTFDGAIPALDVETPVARACGRVNVAVADHHGYFDACGPAFVQALDAQAYVIPSWDIGHPGSAQMQRMEGAWDANDGKAAHDVFALELLPQNALINRRFSGQLKSQQGHVVVRVSPGGNTYQIYVLDSSKETSPITGVFGPYTSRAQKKRNAP